MKTMAITEFKTHALRVLDAVADSKERVVVTKRGRPLAEIIPYTESKTTAGHLANTFVFEEDIVAPLGVAEVHIEQGKIVDAKASVKKLRAKYRV